MAGRDAVHLAPTSMPAPDTRSFNARVITPLLDLSRSEDTIHGWFRFLHLTRPQWDALRAKVSEGRRAWATGAPPGPESP